MKKEYYPAKYIRTNKGLPGKGSDLPLIPNSLFEWFHIKTLEENSKKDKDNVCV